MSKYVYLVACILSFAAGVYVWKVKNTGLVATLSADTSPQELRQSARTLPASPTAIVVEVGAEKLTQEDVDWEYGLLTAGLTNKDELTPIPDLGDRLDHELEPLRKTLIANLIERKLLFAFIQQDKEFSVDEPGRYQQCMNELQETLATNPTIGAGPHNKQRLRNRLCERSVLDQYMHERLFTHLAISEAEIVEYYKNHSVEFQEPERVEIRQILLAEEGDAKRVRNQVNGGNFEALARSKSIAPEAVDGGHLGPFSKATLPSLYEMAAHMKKGEISAIMKSPYGYHIIQMLDKRPKEELSLEVARPKILATLRRKKEGEEYHRWVEKALASIAVSTPKPLW